MAGWQWVFLGAVLCWHGWAERRASLGLGNPPVGVRASVCLGAQQATARAPRSTGEWPRRVRAVRAQPQPQQAQPQSRTALWPSAGCVQRAPRSPIKGAHQSAAGGCGAGRERVGRWASERLDQRRATRWGARRPSARGRSAGKPRPGSPTSGTGPGTRVVLKVSKGMRRERAPMATAGQHQVMVIPLARRPRPASNVNNSARGAAPVLAGIQTGGAHRPAFPKRLASVARWPTAAHKAQRPLTVAGAVHSRDERAAVCATPAMLPV